MERNSTKYVAEVLYGAVAYIPLHWCCFVARAVARAAASILLNSSTSFCAVLRLRCALSPRRSRYVHS